jgi:hypothetical protein
MKTLTAVLMWSLLGIDFVAPVAVLLFVKRRSGSWQRAAFTCLLTATVVAFLVNGTVGWLLSLLQWAIRDGSPYRGMAFPVCGVYGMLFAGTGLLYLLPMVGLWRLAHRRSFECVTRQRVRPIEPAGEVTTECKP